MLTQLTHLNGEPVYTRRVFKPQGFGMIPSWQYSLDPGINIKVNPNVKFPSGWTQTTVQPYDGQQSHPDLSGAFHGAGFGLFDSWAWDNRKWLVLGGAGLLGVAGLLAAGALLR